MQWHHVIIKFRFILFFGMIFQTTSISLVYADTVGTSLTLLSIHTNPGNLALREQYPRRIDEQAYAVITPGIESYYQQTLSTTVWDMNDIRLALGVGYDCADLKSGYIHWGGRWIFPWKEHLQLDLGLGPTLYFRESWSKKFGDLVADETGFWIESDNFLPGYQHKWLLGGNIELQYEITPNFHAYWAVIPAVIIVVVNSFGVSYSF